MEIATRPIVVTGATGFIGKHLTGLFDTGNIPYVKFTGDITIEKEVQEFFRQHRPERIIHLAGKHTGSLRELQSVNVQGVLNILDAANQYACPHIIYASSAAVYGNVMQMPGAQETDQTAPNTPYGESKVEAERHIVAAGASGIRSTILRLGSVYGPGQTAGIIPTLTHSIQHDHVVYYDQVHPVFRHYIHVDDVCRVIISLLANSYTGVINLASNDMYSLKDLADILAQTQSFTRKHRASDTAYTDMRLDISLLRSISDYQPTLSQREYLLQ